CHLKHCCLLDRRLWPEKRPRQQSGAKCRVVMCADGCLDGSPSPLRVSPNRVCGIGSMVGSVANNDRGAATAGRFQAWSRHRCVPCQTFVRLSVSARPATHLREGDHEPRPHQLIERCSSQKQKPGSERESKVGGESM